MYGLGFDSCLRLLGFRVQGLGLRVKGLRDLGVEGFRVVHPV